MKLITFLAALFSIIAFSSCSKALIKGEGSVISETRELANFQSVEANGDVSVTIYPSSSNRVIVTGYQNLIPVYETKVKNGKLTLEYKRGYINVRNNNISVVIYTTDLNSFYINGSGKTKLKSDLTSKSMSLEINGSGDIDVENNQFDHMHLKINGSGNINARQATGKDVKARISGSGNIDVSVSNKLDVSISGSGDVHYWGNPESVNTDISGSGKVKKN